MHKILIFSLLITNTILFSSAPQKQKSSAEIDAHQLAGNFYHEHNPTFRIDNLKGNTAATAAYLAGLHFELIPTLIEEQRKTNVLLTQLIKLLAPKPVPQTATAAAPQVPPLQLIPPANFPQPLPSLAPAPTGASKK